MNSIEEINYLIAEYQDKINQLQKEKIKINFINYFEISKSDIKKMKNLKVEGKYEYNDHVMDEYGHSTEATLKITFDDKEYFNIEYTEEQGKGTESRYSPTIYCNITASTKAKKIILKNLDISIDDNEEYEWRDLIEEIVTK